MASTFLSDKAAANIPAKETNQHVVAVSATYEIAAALVVNDVIQMVKVPKGAQILELILSVDDLDSDGSAAIVLDVGDGGDTDRFIDGSTIGQTGGSARLGSGVSAATTANSFGYTYTADDTIDVLVQVAPATGATSGTIKLTALYHCDA